MSNSSYPKVPAPDAATLAKKTRKAMDSIARKKQEQEKSAMMMGAALGGMGDPSSSGNLSKLVWGARLAIAAVAVLICGYAFWMSL